MVYNIPIEYRYHGGRKKGIKYDFSVNVNPFGPPEIVHKIMKENIDLIRFYPEEESKYLKKLYANKWGLEPENIIFGNGASELIFLYINTLSPKKIIIPIPSFSEYYIASTLRKREIFMPMYREKKEIFLPPIEKILRAITPDTLIIIGNPNNPTGTLYREEEILTLLEYAKKKDAYLFIDEAFIDFVDNTSSSHRLILLYPNLFLLRSFTKIFTIPGIRLGMGIGNKEILKRLELSRDPWSVNIFSQYIGRYLIEEEEFIKKTKKLLSIEREFIYKNFSLYDQLKIYKTYANFYLLKFLKVSTLEVMNFLLKNNIYVRDVSNFIGLSDRFIRVAIKTRRENELFIKCIKTFIDNLHSF